MSEGLSPLERLRPIVELELARNSWIEGWKMNAPEFHVPPMPEVAAHGYIVVFRIAAADQAFLDRLEQIGAQLERTENVEDGIQFWITVWPDSLTETLSVLKAEKCNVLYTSAP